MAKNKNPIQNPTKIVNLIEIFMASATVSLYLCSSYSSPLKLLTVFMAFIAYSAIPPALS